MTDEVVVDADLLIAQLDGADRRALEAQQVASALRAGGARLVLLDFLVQEALSVLCMRAWQRKGGLPPNLGAVTDVFRRWASQGSIRWMAQEGKRWWPQVLAVVETSRGALDYNDGLLVVLQHESKIGAVATLNERLCSVPGFRRAP